MLANLLKKNKVIDIKNYLDDCFFTKLDKFVKDKNIKIDIEYPEFNYKNKDFNDD